MLAPSWAGLESTTLLSKYPHAGHFINRSAPKGDPFPFVSTMNIITENACFVKGFGDF
jgi:hypothetical protein